MEIEIIFITSRWSFIENHSNVKALETFATTISMTYIYKTVEGSTAAAQRLAVHTRVADSFSTWGRNYFLCSLRKKVKTCKHFGNGVLLDSCCLPCNMREKCETIFPYI